MLRLIVAKFANTSCGGSTRPDVSLICLWLSSNLFWGLAFVTSQNEKYFQGLLLHDFIVLNSPVMKRKWGVRDKIHVALDITKL